MMHDSYSYLISLCFLMLILSLPERFIFPLKKRFIFPLFLTNSCHAFRNLTRIFFLRQILASFIFSLFCITSHWTFQIKRDMKDFSRCKDDTKCLSALYLQNYTLKWCFNRNLIILTNACEAAHGCLRLIRFKQIDACTVSLPHLSSYISFSWLIEMFNRNIRPLIVSSCMSCIKIQISAFPCLFFGTLVYNSFISSFSVRL